MAGIIKTSINLTKIPKDKIIDGAKGKYLPITITVNDDVCLLYTSPSPRDGLLSRMPSSA